MQPFQVGTGMALDHTGQILVNLNWTPVTVLGEYWPDTGQFLQQQHLLRWIIPQQVAAAGTLGLSLNVSRMVTKQAGAFYLVLKGGNGGLGKLLARTGEQM